MSLFLLLLIMSTDYLRVSLSHEVSQNDATLIDLLMKYKIATIEQKYDSQLEIMGKKLDHQQEELENLKTKQKEIENDIIHEDVKSTLYVDIQSQIAQETSTSHRHEKEIQALQSGFHSIKINIRSMQTAFFHQKSIIKNISLWESCDKIEARLERLEEHLKQISRVTIYNDCMDITGAASGVYTIKPVGSDEAFDVYCDMDTDGGGWTVFQRRQDGSEIFIRSWLDYEIGFGTITGEFWLGNSKIHAISQQGPYELRIDLEDFSNNTAYAKYSEFTLGDASTNYRLGVSGYNGTAGDSLSYHDQAPFSTADKDNDNYSGSCAVLYNGAWWYNYCINSNLNGLYHVYDGDAHISGHDGVVWYDWKGSEYSLKTTEMKMRKILIKPYH